MIKQDITYEDFDGNEVTETHYFHLSKTELIDMELATDGGMSAKLELIGKSGNGGEIMQAFKEIVGAAYGQRVDGSGSQFYKTPEISKQFLGSLAFDAFLTRLLTDPQAAISFVNGIMPKDLAATAEVRAALAGQNPDQLKLPEDKLNAAASGLQDPRDNNGEFLPWAFREPTALELTSMTKKQMTEVYARKSTGWVPLEPVSG